MGLRLKEGIGIDELRNYGFELGSVLGKRDSKLVRPLEIRYTTAIVEFIHNGQVTEVMPSDIIFCHTEKQAKLLGYKKVVRECPHGYLDWDNCPDCCH